MEENLINEASKLAKLKNCIVCKKDLFSVFPAEVMDNPTQPSGAISFRGSGEYGSGFDYNPDYDENYEFVVNVCDECITESIQAEEVLVHTKEIKVVHNYRNAKLS